MRCLKISWAKPVWDFFYTIFKNGKVGGAIVHNPGLITPGINGALVYLNCQPDLQVVLDRVENAGGKILKKKTNISEDQQLGYWALMNDTEGNNVALHSMS